MQQQPAFTPDQLMVALSSHQLVDHGQFIDEQQFR
jgi:hypothetical protein